MRVRRTQKEKRIARHFGGEEIFDMRSAFFVQTFFSPLTPLFEKLFQQQKIAGLLSKKEWFHLRFNGSILVLGFVF